MSKSTGRLREFEKNNRVIDLEESQRQRRERSELRREIGAEDNRGNVSRLDSGSAYKRNKKRRRKINTVRLVFIALIVGVGLYFSMYLLRVINLTGEKNKLEQRSRELAEQKELLTMRLQSVQSDFYIEMLARNRLKMIKEGEVLYVFSRGEDKIQEEIKDAIDNQQKAKDD